jgi:hypothetical protein
LHKWLAAETHLVGGDFLKSVCKQVGASEIAGKNWNTSNIQKRRAVTETIVNISEA